MQKIFITTKYITLGQMLKFAGIITNGCEAKMFLENSTVLVDGVEDNRRGRKLYPTMTITIQGVGDYVIEQDKGE
ncbi:RNA-binding S4 domain-containing protein [Ureaplasma ceti]|uniref:S4 domain-containing protein YaaA n=1 Tax=Ureaplasma ceti TaxID=3119530 RepID=A0ABP9UA02_9BACT